jgi:hypothetical protein
MRVFYGDLPGRSKLAVEQIETRLHCGITVIE